ncbi:type II toxin-antitoxin system Phd/YefM family antitoxin [Trinickia dabaoshanensis]|uniref:type II toxin-antitoxin system Phd/YefM family antitoxin n=1 Tax=Trinickia dabaoshanensis TaxID=564714 RepID=UPI0011AFC13B|nr:type II toxin-antitoxin system Phd/YefM family antitoxin [Trinickia dabaoshanensis]
MIRTVVERFVEQSPAAVMARLVMQWSLQVETTQDPTEKEDGDELTREQVFALVVQALAPIEKHAGSPARSSCNLAPEFGSLVTSLHDKMSRVHPHWARSLITDSVDVLRAASMPRKSAPLATASGYRLRVLGLPSAAVCDEGPGRVAPIDESARTIGSAPMVLPVYDPELAMIVDLLPYDRSRARGRRIELQSVRPGELWIVDEGVDAGAVLMNWPRHGAAFIVRDTGVSAPYRQSEAPREEGAYDGGMAYEQSVETDDDAGGTLSLRRIVWRLADTMASMNEYEGELGDETFAILTNAPAHQLDATEAIRLFRTPWRDGAPLPLEALVDDTVLASVAPRATWLASGFVALAYNMLSTMMRAVASTLELDRRELAKLSQHMTAGIGAAYPGMMIALPPEDWRRFDTLPDAEMREILGRLAIHLDPRSERRKRRDQRAYTKTQASLRAATLERLLRDDGEMHAAGPFKPHTIAMATRDFSANPSRALRHANESLVMVTKYNRPIALLVSIDDWNRLMGEVRETSIERLSLDRAGHGCLDAQAMFGERSFN